MDIYILNRELNIIGIASSFQYILWRRNLHTAGEFTAIFPFSQELNELLIRGNILKLPHDSEGGIILSRRIAFDEAGNEQIEIEGQFITSYLSRRIVWNTLNLKGTAEQCMRQLVESQCINVSSERKIPLLTLDAYKGLGEELVKQVTYDNLLESLTEISILSELGFRIDVDIESKVLVFRVFKGIDRTSESSHPCLFSRNFENVLSQEFYESLSIYRNVCLVGGMGEGIARKLVTVGQGTGLDRYELFSDADHIRNELEVNGEVITMNDKDYLELLKQNGYEKLEEHYDIKTFQSMLNLEANLKYKDNFDIGDYVTEFDEKWRLLLDAQIKGIEELYSRDEKQVSVIFGDDAPTLAQRIKTLMKGGT